MAKILLIINLQKEFKDHAGMYESVLKYCKDSYGNYDVILPTLFSNDYNINPNFVDKLNYEHCVHTSSYSLDIYPKNIIDSDKCFFEILHGYASERIFEIANKGDVIDIVGCDADSSILATAFKLWDSGYNFRLLTDYIYTNVNEFYGITREVWINFLRRNFGKCVIIPKRRFSFDATFIASSDKYILYKGESFQADVALYFEYKLTYKNGEELYLKKDSVGFSSPLKFDIDKDYGYVINYEKSDLNGVVGYCPSFAAIWRNPNEPVNIPFEDGVQLLKDYFDFYDSVDNKPAQCVSYGIREIDESSDETLEKILATNQRD